MATTVFIGAGASNGELDLTYHHRHQQHLLDHGKSSQHNVCSTILAQMDEAPRQPPSASHGGMVERLAGQLCELALEQAGTTAATATSGSCTRPGEAAISSNGSKRILRIASCRRPRGHTAQSLAAQPASVLARSSAMMALSLHDIRRQRASSAPTPLSPSREAVPSIHASSLKRDTDSQHYCPPADETSSSSSSSSLCSGMSRKRRLSLDVDVPSTVLKRRGAISPLAVPSLECFIRQTRARLDEEAEAAAPSLVCSPVLSMADDDTSCPSTDDELEHDDSTPWKLL
ncbi:hypothetical protein SYNPS1DRAFT_29810 [Syncephalis pseudoplumigaleata]|uniref:Uncharacterized protein n=1 Tax=Syncephalis pseudoplumigaleata TaxID=1712513 RepID=A0A4P9YYK0_9FUNG|nr:hypothetical protein SYNPS1DRAFT_29810 [Syncephalis pseudoplumigaleata]|eukprot:RKP24431.1 hypothetical protein SYNPS1DRAFT_29810 [Syncephalis pseudoplumigaleata]